MTESIRIFSDVHYGDRSSRVRRLAQLRPLCDWPGRLVLNGDTVDTRPSPRPEAAAAQRDEVLGFFGGATLVTGNHDPDISEHHLLDLAGGRVLALHGDIVFESVVPWGRDAARARRCVRAALAALPPEAAARLEDRLRAVRRAIAPIPQKHQAERAGLRYWPRLAFDVAWPPWRAGHVFLARWAQPGRIAALARGHRPAAGFAVVGHTHKAEVRRFPGGPTVINTGSLCFPFGAACVDLEAGRLTVRRIRERAGEFRAGEILAQFALGDAAPMP